MEVACFSLAKAFHRDTARGPPPLALRVSVWPTKPAEACPRWKILCPVASARQRELESEHQDW